MAGNPDRSEVEQEIPQETEIRGRGASAYVEVYWESYTVVVKKISITRERSRATRETLSCSEMKTAV